VAPIYEVRPRKDHLGIDLISDVLPFGRLWYDGMEAVANAIGYAEHYSRSHGAVIRVYDAGGIVIETHEHNGRFPRVGIPAVSVLALAGTPLKRSLNQNQKNHRPPTPRTV
jgi:hypothetical protein